MKRTIRSATAFLFLALFSYNAYAITWFPAEFTCPIDNEKNTFLVVGSYGSYIYSYPSKYQWLFFPHTDSPTFYLCKKCHLATYMWDFDELPKDRLPAVRKVLADVKLAKNYNKEYTEVPVIERLEIMEKVYAVLDKDEEWWEDFYRVKGYHYGKAGKAAEAAEARKKSLAILSKWIKDEKDEHPKKIVLYISGAMKHFLGDDKGALEDLNKALTVKYQEKDATSEELKNAEENLNDRLKEYIARINSEDKPRLKDSGDED
jgi:hypothetical protein